MVKKHPKFTYGKNLKRAWRKEKSKKNPKVLNETLQAVWDEHKSIEGNYADIGLCSNPNKSIGIPKTKTLFTPEVMSLEMANELEKTQKRRKKPTKSHVLDIMEEEANREQEKKYNLNENDCLYCIYMLEKYGEDYVKAARDYKNVYQDTPKQIKKRINQFKNMKIAYSKYLADKQSGVNFLDKLDEKF